MELELAKAITRHFPSVRMLRFVNSGCEATMLAIRLARAYTRRDYVIKFDGCYHGANDSLLVKASGEPSSAGVLTEAARKVLVAKYNDLDSVERAFKEVSGEVAAIIVEPVACNMGLVLPDPSFLKGLRELCDKYSSLLIFDEVVTGFRVARGGAQELYGVEADVTTLGKAIGGGFPIGAVGGREDIMSLIAPSGPVYNAGTFNAHPIAMVAGLATLRELESDRPYEIANRACELLANALREAANELRIEAIVNRIASICQIFFASGEVKSYDDALHSNAALYEAFHEELLKRGFFIPPSQLEACFTSAAHVEESLDGLFERVVDALKAAIGR